MFENFLEDIAPYVIVVGSFARKEEHDESDIDCYLRNRPPEDVDPEIRNDTFMPEILDIIQRYGYFVDSVIVGHIAVERQPGVPRMVEISSHYKIPTNSNVFQRIIHGVRFLCAVDDKECPYENCYDTPEWDDSICDMVIRNPLPNY